MKKKKHTHAEQKIKVQYSFNVTFIVMYIATYITSSILFKESTLKWFHCLMIYVANTAPTERKTGLEIGSIMSSVSSVLVSVIPRRCDALCCGNYIYQHVSIFLKVSLRGKIQVLNIV